MTIYNKIKWVLGILMIFVIVISTNLIDKDNFRRVRDTVVNIYQDRLVANDLIFKISNKVNEKEIALISNDLDFFLKKNLNINKSLDNLIFSYEGTKLTQEEQMVFNDLKSQINTLIQLDTKITSALNDKDKSRMLQVISSVKQNLIDLSAIQLNEGSKQMSISKKAISTIELFTQIEIYFLVFLAVIVQFIIIYDPQKKKQ